MVRASSSISAHPGKSGGAYPALVMSYWNCSWFTSCSSLSEQPANKPTTAANAASTAILFMAPPALCTAEILAGGVRVTCGPPDLHHLTCECFTTSILAHHPSA